MTKETALKWRLLMKMRYIKRWKVLKTSDRVKTWKTIYEVINNKYFKQADVEFLKEFILAQQIPIFPMNLEFPMFPMATRNFQFAFNLVVFFLFLITQPRLLHRRFRIMHVLQVPFTSNISQKCLTFFLKSSGVGFCISVGFCLNISFILS